MTEFFIANNSGDVVYPLKDEEPSTDWSIELVKVLPELNRNGFQFYAHPEAGRAVSFFKGSRGTRNQFYGVLNGTSETDLLKELKQRVEEAFQNQGWMIAETETGGDAIYTGMTTAEVIEDLAIEERYLSRLIKDSQDDEPVELGAPDTITALQMSLFLFEQYGQNIRVSICESGIVDDLPLSDVVVIPNDSEEPGQPVRATKEKLDKIKLESRIDDAKAETERLLFGDENRHDSSGNSPGQIANALNPLSFGGDKFLVETEDQRKYRLNQPLTKYLFTGAAVGLLFSIIIGWMFGIFGSAVNTLTRTIYLHQWPIRVFDAIPQSVAVESWYVVVGCVVTVTLSTVDRRRVQGGLGMAHQVIKNIYEFLVNASADDEVGNNSVVVSELQTGLERIQENSAADDRYGGFLSIVQDHIFTDTAIEVEPAASAERAERRAAAKGFAVGLAAVSLIAGLTGAVAVGIDQLWIPFINGAIAVALLTGGWTLGKGLFRLIWGFYRPLKGFLKEKREWSSTGLFGGIARWNRVKLGLVSLGIVSCIDLWADIWASGEGIAVQALTVAAAETFGRAGFGIENGVELLFFFTLSYLLIWFSTLRYATGEKTYPEMVTVAMVVGVGAVWATGSGELVKGAGAAVGVPLGIIVGVASAKATTELVTTLITTALRAGGVYIIVERIISYQSPLLYDTETQQIVTGTFGFEGLESLSAFVAGELALIIAGVAFLPVAIKTGRNRAQVLILGPQSMGSDDPDKGRIGQMNETKNFITLLYHAMKYRDDIEEITPNNHLSTLIEQPEMDFEDELASSEILDIEFSFTIGGKREGVVTFPYMQEEYLTDSLNDQIDQNKKALSRSSDSEDDGAVSTVADAVVRADVILLLFPVESALEERSGSSPNNDVGQELRYLPVYKDLIYDHLMIGKSDPEIIGVATEAARFAQRQYGAGDGDEIDDEVIRNNFMDLRLTVTDHVANQMITEQLDNGVQGNLYVPIWLAKEGELGSVRGADPIVSSIVDSL
ncbi:hypothetical protein [Halosimplex pelagicum]|uniref:Uncharacterized protein n=1 Tax=Halosimplex pelagicum TaxID=869886 RepID=A0A7D5P915_9EURY|nr:hypothetical protein [Halosimplex pelagicum]QLH83763.1 hypothetical protein HZS54_19960 [Halosimplex pelagicum]